MIKRILITACIAISTVCMSAQTPKWYKKAKKTQITVFTFDQDDNLLHSGNGFYISEDGIALANYQLFKGASSAKIVDAGGKEYPVSAIMGASSLYDVVKFKVETPKKTATLKMADRAGVKHEAVYIMPYPTSERPGCHCDTLLNIQTFNNDYHYYTLKNGFDDKYVNCPVFTEEGELLAMIQQQATGNSSNGYAIGVNYGASLCINAMSASDNDLNGIHIRKALPDEEDEAATFLYMAAGMSDSASYQQYLDAFIEQFPTNPNAYTQRADFYLAHGNYAKAEADIETSLEKNNNSAETYYTFGKMLYQLNLRPDYQIYKDWNMEKAISMAEEAIKRDSLPLYVYQAGLINYALKAYEKAYAQFVELTKTNMRSADLFLYAAQCKTMMDADTLEILALQDSAVACFKQPYPQAAAQSLMSRANTLLQLKRYKEAIIDLNAYERLMSNDLNAKFYYIREQAEMKSRMYQQAMDDIDRAIRMAPTEPLYHAERAVIFYRIGEFEEAIKSCQNAIKLAPQYADAYRIMGICQVYNKKREEGMANLQKAATLGDTLAKDLIDKKDFPE